MECLRLFFLNEVVLRNVQKTRPPLDLFFQLLFILEAGATVSELKTVCRLREILIFRIDFAGLTILEIKFAVLSK